MTQTLGLAKGFLNRGAVFFGEGFRKDRSKPVGEETERKGDGEEQCVDASSGQGFNDERDAGKVVVIADGSVWAGVKATQKIGADEGSSVLKIPGFGRDIAPNLVALLPEDSRIACNMELSFPVKPGNLMVLCQMPARYESWIIPPKAHREKGGFDPWVPGNTLPLFPVRVGVGKGDVDPVEDGLIINR